jgi:elongator complex protein 5
VVLKKKARDRSQAEPVFGLAEGKEGVIVSSPTTRSLDGGTVIRMEIRRKSGRGVRESFVFYPPSSPAATNTKTTSSTQNLGSIILLDDHPSYSPPDLSSGTTKGEEGGEEAETTFKLGLTEKQRKDREGVILPYFDAQKDGGGAGPGEGGRILYEMGEEDREDFDDEEDEI